MATEATLTVQNITRAGLNRTTSAAAVGGDAFTPSKDTVLYVFNAGGSPITVTAATPGQVIPNVDIGNSAATITNGQDGMVGPFPYEYFANASGLVDITYSGVTSVTVAALKLNQP